MAQVITLENYRPIARYDGVAWTQARIEESASTDPSSSYTSIETINLSTLPGGVDSDPTQPASRNLTSDAASDTLNLWYRVVFIDGSANESAPTDPVQNTTSSNLYATISELKTALSVTATTWDEELYKALSAASRAIDKQCGRRFYADTDATSVRYYTASNPGFLVIDDLVTLTSVLADTAGTGSYSTTLTSGTHFDLTPLNAASDNEPYTCIEMRPQSGQRLPCYPKAVKVTGKFGWPTVPPEVNAATTLLASRLFKRTREAPLGVYGFAGDGTTVRISRTDPDVAALLNDFSRKRVLA